MSTTQNVPWIDQLLIGLREKYPDKFAGFYVRPVPSPTSTPRTPTRRTNVAGSTHYGLRALEVETLRLLNAVPGTRNATLNTVTFVLFQLVAGRELDRSEAESAIRSAAEQCGLEPNEITRTMGNGIKAGLASPRSAPDDGRGYDADCPDIPAYFFDSSHPQYAELKRPAKVKLPKLNITIGFNEYDVNTLAISALSIHPDTFVRGGMLSHVTYQEARTLLNNAVHIPAGAKISVLQKATLRERLTEVVNWSEKKKNVNADADPELIPARTPDWCVNAIISRGSWPGVRPLNAVVEFPVFLPDGAILSRRGYDESSGLYAAPVVPVSVDVPDSPTHADAVAALDTLYEAICEFPFVADHHRSAWLAGVLTPLARFAFAGPSPMFLVEANVPGAGKGLLVNAANLIVRGEEAAQGDFSRDGEEMQKVVTAILLQGETIALFDNIEGNLGGAVLNKLLTASIWEGRILGQSETRRLPNLCTWWATGNNVAVLGDTARRVCSIRLESQLENPETRTDLRELAPWIRENRPRLLSAALTILCAYHAAGRPKQNIRPWGSYGPWSELIRGAIVWAGWPDPLAEGTVARQEDDPVRGAMGVLLEEWDLIDRDHEGLTSARIIDEISKLSTGAESLKEALEILAPANSRSRPGTLGAKLREYCRRLINGRMIDHFPKKRGLIYWYMKNTNKPSPNRVDMGTEFEIDLNGIPKG